MIVLVFNEIIANLRVDALMRSGAVVVLDVFLDNPKQLVAIENEHVIETFTLQAANEAFTEGISPGSLHWHREKVFVEG